jgi:DNA-3-methyladenine glycosylase I
LPRKPRATRTRCEWATGEPILTKYHDFEWGTPEHDDRRLFEFLVLEGMQAGLSWLTVLKKRENFRRSFDQFDPDRVARYGAKKVQSLLRNDGIIRNRMKIEAAIHNAQAFRRVQEEFGGFDPFMWRFVGGRPIENRWTSMRQIPASTTESDSMSKALKERGFKFVGTTICYAHMQAVGMVNDHVLSCFRRRGSGAAH